MGKRHCNRTTEDGTLQQLGCTKQGMPPPPPRPPLHMFGFSRKKPFGGPTTHEDNNSKHAQHALQHDGDRCPGRVEGDGHRRRRASHRPQQGARRHIPQLDGAVDGARHEDLSDTGVETLNTKREQEGVVAVACLCREGRGMTTCMAHSNQESEGANSAWPVQQFRGHSKATASPPSGDDGGRKQREFSVAGQGGVVSASTWGLLRR